MEEAILDVASTPTYTDGGAMGIGFVVSTGDVSSSDGNSDSTNRLILKFEVRKLDRWLGRAETGWDGIGGVNAG